MCTWKSQKITTSLVIGPWLKSFSTHVLRSHFRSIPAVDWGEMAKDNNYLRSAASTRNVGKHVASVIDRMVTEKNASLDEIHIVGHSLGAHTAG